MSNQPDGSVLYEFGPFRVDSEERLLIRAGVPIPLAPKVVETLLVLLERGGRVVTKEELMSRLWPDTFVQESNLSQNVFLLRKALGDEGYIETVPRRGYRFVREVRPVVGSGEELVVSSRTTISLVEEETEVTDGVAVTEATAPAARTLLSGRLRTIAGVSALVAAAMVAGGLAVRRADSTTERPSALTPPARHPVLAKLTFDSKSYDPAVSPDGKFIAYKILDGDRESVWVRNIATRSAVQVMPPIAEGYSGLTFSPDGNELYYRTTKAGVNNGLVARIPVFGGAPREVVRNVWSDFTLSPDGRKLAFVRVSGEPKPLQALTIVDVDSGSERVLVRNRDKETWFMMWASSPAWSPDGKSIAMAGGVREVSRDRATLWEVRVADGSIRELPNPGWHEVSQVAWLPNGSGLLLVAREREGDLAQIWLLPQPAGAARRITNDLDEYRKVRVSRDAQVLVAEQLIQYNHLWLVPGGEGSKATQLTSGIRDNDGFWGLSWTPEGRVLFVSDRTGQKEIWSMLPDGTDLRQLTVSSAGSNHSPRMTPDGRSIVFVSNRSGKPYVWRMDADGSHPVRLTNVVSSTPGISPDGQWVYFTNYETTPARIDRIPIAGGPAVPVPTEPGAAAGSPAVSPDGRMLAYTLYSDKHGWRSALTRLEDGKTLEVFDWYAYRGQMIWSRDSKAILYVHHTNSVSNLRWHPLDGRAPRPLTDFKESRIWNFAVSPDGKDFVVSRGEAMSDIVAVSNWLH